MKELVSFGEKFLGQGSIGSFFLPEDVNDPPSFTIEE
jgi:hypothetical protein